MKLTNDQTLYLHSMVSNIINKLPNDYIIVLSAALYKFVKYNNCCVYESTTMVKDIIDIIIEAGLVKDEHFYDICYHYNATVKHSPMYYIVFDNNQGGKIANIKSCRVLFSTYFKGYNNGLKEVKHLIESNVAIGPLTYGIAAKYIKFINIESQYYGTKPFPKIVPLQEVSLLYDDWIKQGK